MKRKLWLALGVLVVLPLLIAGALAEIDWYLFFGVQSGSLLGASAATIGMTVSVLLFYFLAVRRRAL